MILGSYGSHDISRLYCRYVQDLLQAILVITLLYSTWWGTDYLLELYRPHTILLGLHQSYSSDMFHGIRGFSQRYLRLFVGDVAKFSALSSSRNLKRTAATTFMVALIVGYSVSVIGNVATSEDFMKSAVYTAVGADAAVWLFEGQDGPAVLDKVLEVDGVEHASLEILFTPDTSLGAMPVRGIDPLTWRESAYISNEFVDDLSVFEVMNRTDNGALIERGCS